jgi:hypothetical protein
MQPQYNRLTFNLVAGLAVLTAALALAVIAASPGYAKADLYPQVPATQAVVDLRAPDRQAPAPEPSHAAFSGSATTTDNLGPEDSSRINGPVSVPASQPSVSSHSDGLELWSAAAGAGAMLTLGLAGLMAYALTIRRRGAGGTSSTTVAAGH